RHLGAPGPWNFGRALLKPRHLGVAALHANGLDRLGRQEMAEYEVAHLAVSATVATHVDDDGVRPFEQTQRVAHGLLEALDTHEPRDLEIADVARQDLDAGEAEVLLEGLAHEGRRRLLAPARGAARSRPADHDAAHAGAFGLGVAAGSGT